jgi:hypothetical protein
MHTIVIQSVVLLRGLLDFTFLLGMLLGTAWSCFMLGS